MQFRQPTSRHIAITVTVVLLVVLGGGALWIANDVRTTHAETREYRDQHSEAKIVGKTADEIIAMYGEPYGSERGPDRKYTVITYKQIKHGQYCSIVLKDGVAVKVYFDFQ